MRNANGSALVLIEGGKQDRPVDRMARINQLHREARELLKAAGVETPVGAQPIGLSPLALVSESIGTTDALGEPTIDQEAGR